MKAPVLSPLLTVTGLSRSFGETQVDLWRQHVRGLLLLAALITVIALITAR